MKKRMWIWSIVALMSAVVGLNGCKKEEPAPAVSNQQVGEEAQNAAEPAAAETAIASAETEQTTCPVMGGKIDKNIFVEYQGKKVYFCCASCKTDFEKNPEKYLDKLPQFRK